MTKKQKTWRLIYPDGTETITNFDPIEYEKKRILDKVEELLK